MWETPIVTLLGEFCYISWYWIFGLYIFRMGKTVGILLLGFLVIAIANTSQVITFTCQTVDASVCASGFRYRTQGSYQTVALNSYYCVPTGSSCVAGSKQFNLQTCKVDYKNVACSTGVCFMYPQYPVCTKDNTCGTQANPQSYFANYKCDNCANTANCVKCFFKTTNQVNSTSVTTQTCLGASCTQGLSTATATVNRCSNGFDVLGQKCQCCVTTVEVSRFCTSNSAALQQADITTWFNKVEGNTKSEYKLQMFFALALLTILGILY